MIKTITFDFDGTLADTLPICFYPFRRSLDNSTTKIFPLMR